MKDGIIITMIIKIIIVIINAMIRADETKIVAKVIKFVVLSNVVVDHQQNWMIPFFTV